MKHVNDKTLVNKDQEMSNALPEKAGTDSSVLQRAPLNFYVNLMLRIELHEDTC